jgi:hypothetical protein
MSIVKQIFKSRYNDSETNRVDRLVSLCKGDRKFLRDYRVRADGRVSSIDIKFKKSETLVKYNRSWMNSMVSSDGVFLPDQAIDQIRESISKAEVVFSKRHKRKTTNE